MNRYLQRGDDDTITGFYVDGQFKPCFYFDDMLLPDPFKYALIYHSESYSKGKSDFSTTELISSPQKRTLAKKWRGKIAEPLSGIFHSAVGTMVHLGVETALEHVKGVVSEKRFFTDIEVDGVTYTISGAIDAYEGDTSYDLKNIACSQFKGDAKDAHQWQGRINKWIAARANNGPVFFKKLKLALFGRDWSAMKLKFKKKEQYYPDYPAITKTIINVSDDEVEEYIKERIRLHISEPDTWCVASERFGTDPGIAVMDHESKVDENGNRRAKKIVRYQHPDQRKKAQIVANRLVSEKFSRYTEVRNGDYTGCMFCWRRPVCPQFQFMTQEEGADF